MRSLALSLPWPPSLNRIWRALGGRIILSAPAREWKTAAANALPRGRVEPLTGRLIVWLSLHPPASYGKRKWDVANREKLLADLLTEQRVWLDDEQVDVWVMLRGAPDAGRGRVDILIKEY